jgi:hypothetical protein
MKTALAHALWLAVATIAAHAADGVTPEDTRDFSRYQSIIDRSPFGAAASASSAVAQPSFAARYGFVGLVSEADARLVAIIEDREVNPRRSYFMAEGDTFNGIKVAHIERDPSRLVLQQGFETATLAYEPRAGGGSSAPPPAPPSSIRPPSTPPGARRTPFLRRIIENE